MRFLYILSLMFIGSFSALLGNSSTLEEVNNSEKSLRSDVKAIIFDCDGTLVNNGIGYFLDWQHALLAQGYELDSDEFWDFMHKNKLVGKPGIDEIIVSYYCELLGKDCKDEILRDMKNFSHKLHKTYEFPPIKSTVDFLHLLAKEKDTLGLKIAVASANSRENVERVLKRFNIKHYFDAIVTVEDVYHIQDPEGVNKPKPYIYEEVTKRLGFSSDQCVVIEDSVTGVTSAKRAGCTVIAVPNNYTQYHDFSLAHLKLNSLENLTPVDFLQKIKVLKFD